MEKNKPGAPESQWERDYWETVENEYGKTREQIKKEQEKEWQKKKEDNHQDNVSKLHGVFWHGTYYHFGVGQHHRIQ